MKLKELGRRMDGRRRSFRARDLLLVTLAAGLWISSIQSHASLRMLSHRGPVSRQPPIIGHNSRGHQPKGAKSNIAPQRRTRGRSIAIQHSSSMPSCPRSRPLRSSVNSERNGGNLNGSGRRKQQHVKFHGVKIYTAGKQFPSCDPEREVSIATFNILQKNFNFSKKPWVLPEHADWEHRLTLLQDVLSNLNTDIICLQEADIETFETDFAEYMSILGYDTVPPSAKSMKDFHHGHTKPSIFFKRDKFTLHWHNPRSRTTLIALEIKPKNTPPPSSSSSSVNLRETKNSAPENAINSSGINQINDDEPGNDDDAGRRLGITADTLPPPDIPALAKIANLVAPVTAGHSQTQAREREPEGGSREEVEEEYGDEEQLLGDEIQQGQSQENQEKRISEVSTAEMLIEGGVPSPGGGIERVCQPMTQYGQMVYIANCHLQCGGSAGGVNVHHTRVLQMRSALRRMRWHMIRHNIEPSDVALFVCGDFNCPPTDPVCRLLTRGYNTAEEVEQFFQGNDLAFENEIALADSHKFLRETRRRFPTFVRSHSKGNNHSAVGLTMDYIFYTPNTMRLQAVRDPFTRAQKAALRSNGPFPNDWHPSDHLPLVAQFRFESVRGSLHRPERDKTQSHLPNHTDEGIPIRGPGEDEEGEKKRDEGEVEGYVAASSREYFLEKDSNKSVFRTEGILSIRQLASEVRQREKEREEGLGEAKQSERNNEHHDNDEDGVRANDAGDEATGTVAGEVPAARDLEASSALPEAMTAAAAAGISGDVREESSESEMNEKRQQELLKAVDRLDSVETKLNDVIQRVAFIQSEVLQARAALLTLLKAEAKQAQDRTAAGANNSLIPEAAETVESSKEEIVEEYVVQRHNASGSFGREVSASTKEISKRKRRRKRTTSRSGRSTRTLPTTESEKDSKLTPGDEDELAVSVSSFLTAETQSSTNSTRSSSTSGIIELGGYM